MLPFNVKINLLSKTDVDRTTPVEFSTFVRDTHIESNELLMDLLSTAARTKIGFIFY